MFYTGFHIVNALLQKMVKVDGKMMDGLMGVCGSGIHTLHGTDGVVYCDIVIVDAGTKHGVFSFFASPVSDQSLMCTFYNSSLVFAKILYHFT